MTFIGPNVKDPQIQQLIEIYREQDHEYDLSSFSKKNEICIKVAPLMKQIRSGARQDLDAHLRKIKIELGISGTSGLNTVGGPSSGATYVIVRGLICLVYCIEDQYSILLLHQ